MLVISQSYICATNWRKELEKRYNFISVSSYTYHGICRGHFVPFTEAYGVQQEAVTTKQSRNLGKGFWCQTSLWDGTSFSRGLLEGGDAGAHSGLAHPHQGCITSQLLFWLLGLLSKELCSPSFIAREGAAGGFGKMRFDPCTTLGVPQSGE